MIEILAQLKVLSESYPMNTNMTGFRWFSEIFVSLYSIGRANYEQARTAIDCSILDNIFQLFMPSFPGESRNCSH